VEEKVIILRDLEKILFIRECKERNYQNGRIMPSALWILGTADKQVNRCPFLESAKRKLSRSIVISEVYFLISLMYN